MTSPRGLRVSLRRRFFGKESTALYTHLLLPRAAKKERVDILFCPGYVSPLFWRGRSAVTLHDIIYETHPQWFNFQSRADYILLKRFSRRSAQKARVVLTPSEYSASEINQHYSIPNEKIVVTPLGSEPIFTPDRDEAREAELLRAHNIDGPYLFTVGTIQSRRHIPNVLAAFARIAAKQSNLHYLLAGGNMTNPHIDLESLIHERNKEIGREAIHYTDYVTRDAQPHFYRAASALVWLSDYEGFGLPPIEAMACGTPVITSNTTCLPETVGDCALLIQNNNDVDEITKAMAQLLSDAQLQRRLAECGIQQAKAFSWSSCAEKTLRALIE